MERVTIFLRNSLFTLTDDSAHVPAGAMVLDGTVREQPSGGLLLSLERARDHRGRDLEASEVTLFLPWSKVDHVQVHE